jgi:hypothetical protein
MKDIFLGMNWVALVVLALFIGMGFADLYLVIKKKMTLSQKVHAWTKSKWVDALIMVGILILVWWIFTPNVFVPVLGGSILGHLFWYSE